MNQLSKTALKYLKESRRNVRSSKNITKSNKRWKFRLFLTNTLSHAIEFRTIGFIMQFQLNWEYNAFSVLILNSIRRSHKTHSIYRTYRTRSNIKIKQVLVFVVSARGCACACSICWRAVALTSHVPSLSGSKSIVVADYFCITVINFIFRRAFIMPLLLARLKVASVLPLFPIRIT